VAEKPLHEINATDFPLTSAERRNIMVAITHWNAKTIIRLVARGGESDYVEFVKGPNCNSDTAGRAGGAQRVTCSASVWTTVAHEIGHVVGLWHEHTREDRDDYVTVNTANIMRGAEHNFEKRTSDGDDLLCYDYASFMHYARGAAARNARVDTITPKDPTARIGQRDHLSYLDILGVNSVYSNTRFLFYRGTPLPETDGTFAFALAPNNDLFAIKRAAPAE
jgi:hypothetical protein